MLQHVQLGDQHEQRNLEVSLRGMQPLYQARALRSQLSVLPAVQAASAGTNVTVSLVGWNFNERVLNTLPELPPWGTRIELGTHCTWPLEPPQYKRLAALIPSSYTMWHVRGFTGPQIDNVCDGLNEHRAGKGLLPVSVYVYEYGYNHEARLVGEHVILKPGYKWYRGL